MCCGSHESLVPGLGLRAERMQPAQSRVVMIRFTYFMVQLLYPDAKLIKQAGTMNRTHWVGWASSKGEA